MVEPLEVEVDGDARPDTFDKRPPVSVRGRWPRCMGGASIICSSLGDEALCEFDKESIRVTISDIEGFRGMFASSDNDESRESIAKDKKPMVLLLTPKVHLYSDNRV